jgi:DNA-binding CsgD family transcriptional regulator
MKEVAHKLGLSEHTVGDHVKQIYKHFSVSSRAELLAHFISGRQT